MQLGVEAVGVFVLAASVSGGIPMSYGKPVRLSLQHGLALPYCQTVCGLLTCIANQFGWL